MYFFALLLTFKFFFCVNSLLIFHMQYLMIPFYNFDTMLFDMETIKKIETENKKTQK